MTAEGGHGEPTRGTGRADGTRLTRARVLSAALDLVDEEGPEALTMRSLAERLGVVPMALYRHVANKSDLLDGLLDEATSRIALPAGDLGWRDGLAALAQAIRRTLLAHPAVVATLLTRPYLGPAGVGVAEYAYGRMRAAGFAREDIERGVNALLTYTLGFVALEVPRVAPGAGRAPVRSQAEVDAAYAGVSLPHTAAVAPSAERFVAPDQFDYGVAVLLDGLAGRLPPAR